MSPDELILVVHHGATLITTFSALLGATICSLHYKLVPDLSWVVRDLFLCTGSPDDLILVDHRGASLTKDVLDVLGPCEGQKQSLTAPLS